MPEDKLPLPADGRSPAELSKKELVAHLVGEAGLARWRLSVMSRENIVTLFDLPLAAALAAVDAAGKAHGRKHRIPGQAKAETAVSTAAFEHLTVGKVPR